ncbi:LLM class flavin-dependent oxidoreductase [Saccharothrix deserti]|uniref:LLM class flavin-dependent oxidoreductase n=1 Tax=Saccharothrix deserti TaxID=2593674 RepID=UPI00131D61C2|nr:LLM class flavin-dependent oxidoreductase [Saccharothrix deserti]
MADHTRIGWFLGHEEHQPEALVELGRQAEAAGFPVLMVSDHLQPWVDEGGAAGFGWASLGALAATTSRATIVSATVCPSFRYHPVLVAQAAATTSRLSGGRYELGLGTGQAVNEVPIWGPLPPYRERLARVTEALNIIDPLLRGKTAENTGPFYPVRPMRLHSTSTAPVPVYLAASGPRSAAAAGRLTDGVITSVKDPRTTRSRIVDVARQAAADAGRRPPRVLLTMFFVLAEDDDEAYEALHAWRGMRTPRRLEEGDPVRLRHDADTLGRDGVLARFPRFSDPDQVMARCRTVIDEIRPDVLTLQVAAVDDTKAVEALSVVPRQFSG